MRKPGNDDVITKELTPIPVTPIPAEYLFISSAYGYNTVCYDET
jgi:hypothetical protein